MRKDIAALAYLEWRMRVNAWRETLRTPSKLVMVILGIAYYAIFSVLRIINVRAHGDSGRLHEPFATLAFCAVLLFMVMPTWAGARGVLKIFSSFADARFLICSPLREEIVIPYLVLRKSLFSIGRLAMMALLYAIIFPMVGGITGMLFGFLGLFLVGAVLGPFAFRVRTAFGASAAYCIAVVFALVAVVPAAAIGAGALWTGAQPLAHAAVHLGLGRAISAIFAGNLAAMSMLYALFVLLVLLSFFGARDLYPEIFHASYLGMAAVAQRNRGRGNAPTIRSASQLPKSAVSRTSPRGMTGAWAILWKDWVTFRRTIATQWMLAIGTAVALGIGIISGDLLRSPSTALAGGMVLSTALTSLFLSVSLVATVLLDNDIGKPMWWLSASSLRVRLYVWTAATAWRMILPLAVGLVAFGFASGDLTVALLAIPGAAVAIMFLRSIGTALYTIFPWNGGAGSTTGMLRMLLAMLALAPPTLAFIVGSAVAQQLWFGVFCAAIVTIGESALFLEFAVARIAGNGVSIAREAA